MRVAEFINITKNTKVAENGVVARSFWSRFMGLMGRSEFSQGEGLWLTATNSIHMFFMRIPLCVIYIDKQGVVLRIVDDLKPWRIGPLVFKADAVLELPVGTAARTNTEIGDRIERS
jgi:uncharacterized membrane protein (UPF0127 family)